MKRLIKLLMSLILMLGLCACSKTASSKSDTIVFGMQSSYAPFSYYKNGKLTGYDVDVAKAVARKMGMKAVFKTMDNDQLVNALDSKKIDVTGNQQVITYKLNTKKGELPEYWFSTPYKYSRLVVVTRKNNATLKHFDDMRDLKMAMSTGDFFEDSVLDDGGIIVKSKDFDDCMQKVINGKAVGTMNDLLAFQYYMKHHPNVNAKGSVLSANLFPMTFMTRGTDESLATKLDSAVAALQSDGTLKKLSMRYFTQDISANE